MAIEGITLSNFRNFTQKSISFSKDVTLILGNNASGKTNILEAIVFLSTGKSFKARLESEVITYQKDVSRIKGKIDSGINLEIVITNGSVRVGDSPSSLKKAQRKKLLVNGVARRLLDFAGNLKVVIFGPWDMDLVTASPSVRRKFLDSVLAQVDREYRRSSLIYDRGMRQRNRLLLRIRDEGLSASQLLYWDKLLIKHGNYITKRRGDFIDFVNGSKSGGTNLLLNDIQNGEKMNFSLAGNYQLEYDRSEISIGRLKQYEREEVAAATTLVGPHRDDFLFKIGLQKTKFGDSDRDLAKYGSRGEQRMGILWLKLAELSFIKQQTNEKPLLLLDDIFSELDHEHRKIVTAVCEQQQTIVTTADPHYIEATKAKVIRL